MVQVYIKKNSDTDFRKYGEFRSRYWAGIWMFDRLIPQLCNEYGIETLWSNYDEIVLGHPVYNLWDDCLDTNETARIFTFEFVDK